MFISTSYEQSRQRFGGQLAALQSLWPAARRESAPLCGQDDLSIDWFSAGAREEKKRLLVLSCGLHGIEGYVGAAVLEIFVGEYLPRLDPRTTGLLLVHAINPWGMKHWKRPNPANVDLNRNFVGGEGGQGKSFSALAAFNPDYPRLAPYLSPERPLGGLASEKWRSLGQTLGAVMRFGTRRVREAALMGQYQQPTGIYFGGQELQEETRTLMGLYRSHFTGYAQITHLDMHTGYGPSSQMTLVASPREKRSATEITRRYALPRVAAANADEFYTIHGDMLDWEYDLVHHEFPQARFFGAACEFGTLGDSLPAGARSLLLTIFKNRANLFGGDPATCAWVEDEYRQMFCPSGTAWRQKAAADARQTFEGVLGADGYFRQDP